MSFFLQRVLKCSNTWMRWLFQMIPNIMAYTQPLCHPQPIRWAQVPLIIHPSCSKCVRFAFVLQLLSVVQDGHHQPLIIAIWTVLNYFKLIIATFNRLVLAILTFDSLLLAIDSKCLSVSLKYFKCLSVSFKYFKCLSVSYFKFSAVAGNSHWSLSQ